MCNLYKNLHILHKIMHYLLFLLNLSVAFCAINYTPIFEKWANDFSIKFEDEYHRGNVFSSWVSNHVYILKMNAENRTYSLGHNQFSGMNRDEFSAYLGFSSLAEMTSLGTPVENELGLRVRISGKTSVSVESLPASIDWVEKGAVSPVKDQGQCGSCWSFSTTGAIEGAFAIKYGKMVEFSEQQLVDCDNLSNGGRDHGCNGGLMDNAFTWVGKNGGLCGETEYPYVSGTTQTAGVCQKTCKLVAGSVVAKHVDVVAKSDAALMSALAQQPVSIAIEADQRDFQLYKSGVFTGTCGTNLDHGVLVVGYGTDAGLDYYKVKNSWSTSWGENGYIRFGRGEQYNSGSGQCGILLQASFPVL